MHGDVAYCRKHGHDFRITGRCGWIDDESGLEFQLRECMICGYKEIRKVFLINKEEEEEEDDE